MNKNSHLETISLSLSLSLKGNEKAYSAAKSPLNMASDKIKIP